MADVLRSDGTHNLTPTDERQIAKTVSEKSYAKDEALWKGYCEVNFENPHKVKKALKVAKTIIAITRYHLYFFKVKKCDFEAEYSLLDCVQICVVKPNHITLAFKKGMLDREKNKLEMLDKGKVDVKDLKGLKYVNISTEDNRHVERHLLKVLRESIRHSTDSWPVARLKIEELPSEWVLDLADYKPGIAGGILNSYLAVSDYRCKFPDQNFQLFVKCLVKKKCQDLVLSECPGIDSVKWTGMRQTFDLMTITEALEFNTYFESLVIKDVNQKDAAEAASFLMLRNKNLKRLIIKNCGTTFGSDFGYSLYYNKAHSLTVIDLSHNSMPNNASIPMAHSFLSLQHVIKVLCLSHMDISAKGLMALANALSSNWGMSIGLEELDISFNNSDTAASDAWATWFKNIGSDASLKRLSIANTGLAVGQIVPTLAALPLQYLDVSGTKYGKGEEDAIIKFLLETKNIRVLRIAESGLSAETVSKIFTTFPKNASIKELHLDISKNNIGQAGGSQLAQSMKDDSPLRTLNIATMGLKIKGLVSVIQTLPSCVETFICDDNFEASGQDQPELAQALSKLVSTHPKLHTLSIDGKKSQSIGMFLGPLFKTLKTNTTLCHLNISNQDCGDVVFSSFCRALYKNSTLQSIKFSGNNLSYNGFLAFEQALLHNNDLKWIEMLDEKELAYEKMCVGTNRFANDLLSSLHRKCVLRRAGAKSAYKDIFAFDSVSWDTPSAVSPLPPVPARLQSIKSNTDWTALQEDTTVAAPAPTTDTSAVVPPPAADEDETTPDPTAAASSAPKKTKPSSKGKKTKS